ncbi:unnamed protein product, partial [Prunus brigantina]
MEYLCITSSNTQKRILEKLRALSSGLYYTTIETIEAHSVMDQKSTDSNTFKLWHDRLGIDIEHPVPHRLQLIARTLLMKTKLPVSAWGYAILHAASLVRLRPVANNQYSPIQLVLGNQPNISHLRVFGCAVYVPIAPPQRTKMGPQRRLGIYVGFDSPSVIRYLEPLTGDIFRARFADCHFDETIFPLLGEEKSVPKGQGKLVHEEQRELSWDVPTLSHLDPRTAQCENKVRRIVHLQSIANQMPDAFNDATKVTKSHIPAANAPARIDVHNGQNNAPANGSSVARLKRGRPLGSKDSVPRKRKLMAKMNPNEING